MDFPLLPCANRSCGCFCLGSGPVLFGCFCAFWFAFSAGETQVWLGDLRVVALVWLLVLCFASIDLLMSRTVRPCTDVFTAYSHVRTEPLVRHRPNSRKKNFTPENLGALPALCFQAKLTISLALFQEKFAKLFQTIAQELWLRGRSNDILEARSITIRVAERLAKYFFCLFCFVACGAVTKSAFCASLTS